MAIGKLQKEITVYCTICGQERKRKISELVYENTEKEITEAKDRLKVKAAKPYTCRICKSILATA